jgi:ParB family chromosome partitioning protein
MTAKKIARTDELFKDTTDIAESLQQDAQSDALPEIVPTHLIIPNRANPRHDYSEEELAELEASIKQHGFFGALDGRRLPDGTLDPDSHPFPSGTVELGPGSRRLVAARRVGLPTLPVIIHDWDDMTMLTIAMVENLIREDLNPLDTCTGVIALRDTYGLSIRSIAAQLNKNTAWVQDMQSLHDAPSDVRDMVRQRADSVRAARFITRLEDEQARRVLERHIIDEKLTTRQVQVAVQRIERGDSVAEVLEDLEQAADLPETEESTQAEALEVVDLPAGSPPETGEVPTAAHTPTPPAAPNVKRVVDAIGSLNRLEPREVPEEDVPRTLGWLKQLTARAEVIIQELEQRRKSKQPDSEEQASAEESEGSSD